VIVISRNNAIKHPKIGAAAMNLGKSVKIKVATQPIG
jgi:hypothetical protein